MYLSLRNNPEGRADSADSAVKRAVPATVLMLGATSLLTDVASEMVTAILPLFLTLQLGLTPAAFGVIDGLYRGMPALTRLGAGLAADRFQRPKAVASLGYGLSAVARPGLLLASTTGGVAWLLSLDRIGKGIRTSPRDAMIAAASPSDDLGANFGVHRAMDNTGAMMGPLIAFGLLWLLPGDYDTVFLVSSAFGFLGLLVLLLLVPADRPRSRTPRDSSAMPRLSRADVMGLFRSGGYRSRLTVAILLGFVTVSDALLFLALLQADPDLAYALPLLPVGVALFYLGLAVPLGRLADRWGRDRVFLLGHLPLVVAYLLLAFSGMHVLAAAVLVVALLGVFYAATDGVLSAIVSAQVPANSRASALAVLATAVGLTALVTSVAVGVGLTVVGATVTFSVLAVALLLVVAGCWRVLRLGVVEDGSATSPEPSR